MLLPESWAYISLLKAWGKGEPSDRVIVFVNAMSVVQVCKSEGTN